MQTTKADALTAVRAVLIEEQITRWLRDNAAVTVGCIHSFDLPDENWLSQYILEKTGEAVIISNLSITLDDDETFVAGWHYQEAKPDDIPALDSIAPWFPAAIEEIAGDEDDTPDMVTGEELLSWIESVAA